MLQTKKPSAGLINIITSEGKFQVDRASEVIKMYTYKYKNNFNKVTRMYFRLLHFIFNSALCPETFVFIIQKGRTTDKLFSSVFCILLSHFIYFRGFSKVCYYLS